MNEVQVKAITLAHVRNEYRRRSKPIVTAEFSLGGSGARADLVVFGEKIVGFEIKTERDSLRRLPSQMEAYSRYFHRSVAVVATSHLHRLYDHQLHDAELWTYDDKGAITVLRPGVDRAVSAEILLDLLTQAERRKADFHAAMEARYGSTSRDFWRAVAGRSVRPEDLPLLSRFATIRDQARHYAEVREARWMSWLAAQDIELAPSA